MRVECAAGRDRPPAAPRPATARMFPVEAWTATISAAALGAASSALRAAAWICELIVVRTGWPAFPGHCASSVTSAPPAFSATTLVVGEPRQHPLVRGLQAGQADRGAGLDQAPSSRSRPEFSEPTVPTTSLASEANSRWLTRCTCRPGTRASFGASPA